METPHDIAFAVLWHHFVLNNADVDVVIHELAEPSWLPITSLDERTRNHQDHLRATLKAEGIPEDVRALWLGTAILFRDVVGTPVSREVAYSAYDSAVQ